VLPGVVRYQGRSQEFDLGVYVLTIVIANSKHVNVPHVNIYHIESVRVTVEERYKICKVD